MTIGVLWFGVYNVALNAGEQHVDAGTAVMLIQVSPVLVALLAATFLHERFTLYLGLGLALAFGGVALIATASDSGGDRSVLGVVLCLVAAVVYSISLVLQKPLVARLPAIHVTWLACTIGAVVCLPFAGQLVDDTRSASASDIWWVVYLGVFPTAIAFTTFAYALRTMSASSLGVTTYLVPPITIVMGWLFLDETPPGMAYVGGGARAGRRGGGPPQAAHPGRRAAAALTEPAGMPCPAGSRRGHRRGRRGRPGRRPPPLLPGARDVPLGHPDRAQDVRPRARLRRPRARRSPPTRASTTGSWPPAWCGGWSPTSTT